jgi:hypothetical protein
MAETLENDLVRLKIIKKTHEELHAEYLAAYNQLYNDLQRIRLIAFSTFGPESHRRHGYRSAYWCKKPSK